jgi:hypothetical protein
MVTSKRIGIRLGWTQGQVWTAAVALLLALALCALAVPPALHGTPATVPQGTTTSTHKTAGR